MMFQPDKLQFKGEFNEKLSYEIRSDQLVTYGNYLHAEFEGSENFMVTLALKHMLGLIKVCELIEGNFKSAME